MGQIERGGGASKVPADQAKQGQKSDISAVWVQRFVRRLPALVREIVGSIVEELPEYRDDPSGPIFAEALHKVHDAVRTFNSALERAVAGGGGLVPVLTAKELFPFTELGRVEALAGRSHDTLQAAYRIATRTVVGRLLQWEREAPIPAATIGGLSAAVFSYVDALAEASANGYAEALRLDDEAGTRRELLLGFLMTPGGVRRGPVKSWAERLNWPIPDTATLIAVEDFPDDLPALTAFARTVFGPEALAGRIEGASLILVPGGVPIDMYDELAITIRSVHPDARVVIGLSTPVARLDRSLRWLRSVAGRADDRVVVRCVEYLVSLLLDAGHETHDVLVEETLAPLMSLNPVKRLRYGRLLSAWLELGSTRGDEPGVFDKSRQTIRYRTRRLEEWFGPALLDRDRRVAMLLALRVVLPRWVAEAEQVEQAEQANGDGTGGRDLTSAT